MTNEATEEAKPTTRASENSSGEQREPREDQTTEEAKPTTGASENSSGEQREPREDQTTEEAKPTNGASEKSSGKRSEPRDDDADADSGGDTDDVPLNIAGHEDRDPPGEESTSDEEAVASNGGAASLETGTPNAAAGPVDSEDLLVEDGPETSDEVATDEDGDDADDHGGDADEEDEEVEPIELLVQLAKDGEIDPWDIDVVEVTEEFLAALDEGSLRESGRALFYASVLVRMKSDVLLEPEQAEGQAEDPWDAPTESPEDAPPAFDPIDSLEEEMDRRLQRKHVRGTPETLDELVRELREAERGSWWKEGREYDTSGSPAGFDRGTQTVDYHLDDDRRMDGEPTAREVTERTHGEDIEEVIESVRAELAEHYDAGRPEVLFREVEDAGGSRVHSFLAVLFLANRGEVRLQQDELFGDLWIQDPTAELGVEGAVAD